MENNIQHKSLRDRAKEFGARLPFMEGREKGSTDELMGQVCTMTDYGFLPNEAGEMYVAFITAERSGKFYFGGTVMTDRMAQLDQEGYGPEIREEGLPFLMTHAKAKKGGRTYTAVQFYPEG